MATRSILARPVGDGWEGRYHHSDGYPSTMGPLLRRVREHFKGNVEAMLRFVIDEHPAGWSVLDGDLSLTPGYVEDISTLPVYPEGTTITGHDGAQHDMTGMINYRACRPRCFCHGDRAEEEWLFKATDGPDNFGGAQWVYVISERGFLICDDTGAPIQFVGWDEEVDWKTVECGESLQRCGHCAFYHFENLPSDSGKLWTPKYLGLVPLDIQDASAFSWRGEIYTTTGGGQLERKINPHTGQLEYGKKWFATVRDTQGRRSELWVWSNKKSGGQTLRPGLTPIYPATKEIHHA